MLMCYGIWKELFQFQYFDTFYKHSKFYTMSANTFKFI